VKLSGVNLWTDGACVPNPGKGGWAYIVECRDKVVKQRSGCVDHTTNNRMEYTAAIRGLNATDPDAPLTIHTDSKLLINTMTLWAKQWEHRGILDKRKNADLVRQLLFLCSDRVVFWKWVKGHNGNRWNETVDNMCWIAIKENHLDD
jgi:ribonuclease HI